MRTQFFLVPLYMCNAARVIVVVVKVSFNKYEMREMISLANSPAKKNCASYRNNSTWQRDLPHRMLHNFPILHCFLSHGMTHCCDEQIPKL